VKYGEKTQKENRQSSLEGTEMDVHNNPTNLSFSNLNHVNPYMSEKNPKLAKVGADREEGLTGLNPGGFWLQGF